MRTNVRLTIKQFRFESFVLSAALLLLASYLTVLACRVSALGIGACQAPGVQPAGCLDLLRELDRLDREISLGQILVGILPVFAAIVIGVALIGREIERGTTVLAWTVGRSRRRWLLSRGAIIGIAVFALAMVVGFASGIAHQSEVPTMDLANSFERIEVRGPIVAVRAVAAFALSVLAGALLGRTLPALLVAIVAVAAISLGVDRAMDCWARAQAVPLVQPDFRADRVVDARWRDLTTGRVLTPGEYLALVPPPGASPDWLTTNFVETSIGVPGSRAREYLIVESAVLGGLTVLWTAGSVVVVERRRPY